MFSISIPTWATLYVSRKLLYLESGSYRDWYSIQYMYIIRDDSRRDLGEMTQVRGAAIQTTSFHYPTCGRYAPGPPTHALYHPALFCIFTFCTALNAPSTKLRKAVSSEKVTCKYHYSYLFAFIYDRRRSSGAEGEGEGRDQGRVYVQRIGNADDHGTAARSTFQKVIEADMIDS